MTRFAIGFRTTGVGSGSPTLEFYTGAADYRFRLVELGIGITTQTLTPVGLGVPAVAGITPTTPVTLLSETAADGETGTLKLALAWATPPTSPTYWYRRATLGLVSDELVWRWPSGQGLLMAPSSSLVLWLFAASAALDGWAVFER